MRGLDSRRSWRRRCRRSVALAVWRPCVLRAPALGRAEKLGSHRPSRARSATTAAAPVRALLGQALLRFLGVLDYALRLATRASMHSFAVLVGVLVRGLPIAVHVEAVLHVGVATRDRVEVVVADRYVQFASCVAF